MVQTKINNMRFKGYINKFDEIEKVSKIPRDMKECHDIIKPVSKLINTRRRDSRYAYKNRRSINKDWKDFNNTFDNSL